MHQKLKMRERVVMSCITQPPSLGSPLSSSLELVISAVEGGMQRRIRSLQANRLAVLLELVELRVIHVNGSRDVACLPHIGIARALGVVAGQSIRAIEMERSTT